MANPMTKQAAETRDRLGPAPATPVEALVHTLRTYEDSPDGDFALIATGGIYGEGVRTGLTWGDLRALAALLAEKEG